MTAPASTQRLRVLRLASVFPPPAATAPRLAAFDPFGGMQSHTGQLTAALDTLGVAQTVVTAWRPGASRWERLGERSRVARVGWPVKRLRQLYAVAAAPLLPRLAAESDLVHIHLGEDLAVIPLGMMAARAASRPFVLTVHCSLRQTYDGSGIRAATLRVIGGAWEAFGEQRAAHVIALTTRTADGLMRAGIPSSRISVIPSGVNLRRFATPAPDPLPDVPSPRVLFVGRLAEQKDPLTAVAAFSRMRADATLVVVGDGPLRNETAAAVERLGVASRTRMVGFVSHDKVAAFLQHADVLLLPSAYEELGSALLEAMAAGLPIVASATGGIPSVIADGENGLLVEPGDVEGFAAAVDSVLSDQALRDRLGAAAADAAARYDWSNLAAEVLAVYAGVVGDDTTIDHARGSTR